jgi:hypothetical protein
MGGAGTGPRGGMWSGRLASFFFAALLGLVVASVWYLEHLPFAPACPSCRSVARSTGRDWPGLYLLPRLADTFLAKCARCGWRGRMRWRLAPRQVREGGG